MKTVQLTNPFNRPETSPLYAGGAFVGVGLTTLAFLAPLFYTVSVLGGVVVFVAVVTAAVALALLFARALSTWRGLAVGVALLGLGLGVYLLAVPASYWEVITPTRLISDILALLTGYSILQMTTAGVWAIGVAPGPVFVTWFFALRGEYIRGVTVAALTLGFFVLTGDAGLVPTLLGVLGAAAAMAFHTLDAYGGSRRHAEVLAASLAVMILASTAVSAVPGGGASPLSSGGEAGVQGSLVDAGDRQSIQGSIRLSPRVDFVVEADQAAYWRVGAYDRFTGREWVRTGSVNPIDGAVESPPGPRETLVQEIRAMTALRALPAAAQAVRVSGVQTSISSLGIVRPRGTIGTNSTYTVVSERSTATPRQLRNATQQYPSGLSETYLELPENTPDRVRQLTANITAGAENAYDTATAIETWLETNKRYSLNVDRPSGNIADKFLFEMNRGYCVYYATAMVTMLRSQNIPARYVTGYTPGQQVSEDSWVIRGLDSHAWVEVYFPGYGWISFDPTPATVRDFEEQQVIEQARARDVDGVDAAGSQFGTYSPTTTAPNTTRNGTATNTTGEPNATLGGPFVPGQGGGTLAAGPGAVQDPADQLTLSEEDSGGGMIPRAPAPPETLALWGVLAVGLVAGARRTGLSEYAYRSVWLGYLPDGEDRELIEGAFDRVLYLLERKHRPRKQGETIREFLTAVGAEEPARELAQLRERCIHAGTVSADDASRARELARSYIDRHGGPAPTVFNRLIP